MIYVWNIDSPNRICIINKNNVNYLFNFVREKKIDLVIIFINLKKKFE